jgi:predicted ATPase
VRVLVGTDDASRDWEYELRFGEDKGRPVIKSERVTQGSRSLLVRPDANDQADPERLTQTHLEQINVNRAFRDICNFFESSRYLHLVPQLVRDPDRSAGIQGDPYGGDFLFQLAKTGAKERQSRLKGIQTVMKVAVPQLKKFELKTDARGTPHLRGKYEHWRPQGAWQEEQDLSDGTLRLIGLLWSMMDGSGPLLLEEPELSLHSAVVRRLPAMFAEMQAHSGRQVIVSTHSFDIFLDSGIGLDEVLILNPDVEGTRVASAAGIPEIQALLEGGANLAEAVTPRTQPPGVEQLTFPWGRD